VGARTLGGMATCWSELFPELGEPVLGAPGDYATAARQAADVATSVSACAAGFATLAGGDTSQLRGLSATAIADVLSRIDRSLHDLPPVFESLAAVMHTHATRLDALRTEAAAALGRATLRRAALAAAEAALVDTTAALATIDRQLRAARIAATTGDPDAPARVGMLEGRHWHARGRVATAEQTHAGAAHDDRASRTEHAELADAEHALGVATWLALREIDLGELRDPSGLRALAGSIAGWAGTAWDWTGGALVGMVDSLIDAAVACADGRFLDALHHLDDAIAEATRVVTVIAIVVVVAGSTVCPGALVLLPAVIAAGQALSYADVATTGALAVSQHPHPDTGETVGVVDVLATAIGAAVGARASQGGLGTTVATSGRGQAAALTAAGAGDHAGLVFVRTAAENTTVMSAAAAGSAGIVNPATGRTVFGAARGRMVERATLELAGDTVQRQLAAAIDDVIVANIVRAHATAAAEAELPAALAATHPDAEAAIDRHVLGAISAQVRTVGDAWRRGPRLVATTPARPAPYHVVAAA